MITIIRDLCTTSYLYQMQLNRMLLHHRLQRVAALANDQAALVGRDHHFNGDLEVLLITLLCLIV